VITALIVGLVILAGLAQWYRFQRDILGEALSDAHRWVDEIIEALVLGTFFAVMLACFLMMEDEDRLN
jgi:hypothetical protein